jgi:hypothetical protein
MASKSIAVIGAGMGGADTLALAEDLAVDFFTGRAAGATGVALSTGAAADGGAATAEAIVCDLAFAAAFLPDRAFRADPSPVFGGVFRSLTVVSSSRFIVMRLSVLLNPFAIMPEPGSGVLV